MANYQPAFTHQTLSQASTFQWVFLRRIDNWPGNEEAHGRIGNGWVNDELVVFHGHGAAVGIVRLAAQVHDKVDGVLGLAVQRTGIVFLAGGRGLRFRKSEAKHNSEHLIFTNRMPSSTPVTGEPDL